MRTSSILLVTSAVAAAMSVGHAQTTAGTSATIVVPVIAQTPSFGSEVMVYNPNGGAITVTPVFYDAQNTGSPGPKPCTSLSIGANVTRTFTLPAQCALPAGSNFGLLVLSETTGTNRFYGYARTQTPQGVGFSTEGFPIENFNDQLQHAIGLKRVAASGGLPANQTNCFVATLGDGVSYELRLFDGTTNVQLGSTLSGSLAAFQQYRYLDVFALAGVAAGDKTNVRAQFTNLTGNKKKLIGFCTVQENTTFSADFRIAKSYGGTPQNAFVQGGNSFGTTGLLGTNDNQPLEIRVNGQRVARYEPSVSSPNAITGHPNNGGDSALSGQMIGGGGTAGDSCFDSQSGLNNRSCANRSTADFTTIAGGYSNAAIGFAAVVSGGEGNTASGVEAVVAGGSGNTASGRWNAIGGGAANNASAEFTTVAGGHSNIASLDFASVGGGEDNVASGGRATVAGGTSNTASNSVSTVGGGISNTASGPGATVAGGSQNAASGAFATVGGGSGNVADGPYSMVPGGLSSVAFMSYSFAAGRRAKATTVGSFIWADSQNFDFQPSVNNFFGARATGGVGFTVAINPANGAVSQYCNLLPGVVSWQCTSDRNAKENFVAVDSKKVLEQLVAMPLSTWNFKGADPAVRLLGPTAQDFKAAFGLGNDDKSIIATNLHGVALAAIQGLNAIVEANEANVKALLADKDEEIRAQRRELATLRERVAELEDLRLNIASIEATLRTLRAAAANSPADATVAAR